MSKQNQIPISEALPLFADELQKLLTEKGESELAAQVPTLAIYDRCRCKDAICATFYTQARPAGAFGPGHRNVALTPDEGMLILDIVAGVICCVEVLDRTDVHQTLAALIP